ncbi:MAG: hypothetical protein RH917_05205 [Lacipirellulaceae bacterium]
MADEEELPDWHEEATELVQKIIKSDDQKVVDEQMKLTELAPLRPAESLEAFLAILQPQQDISSTAQTRLRRVHTAVVDAAAEQIFLPSKFSFSEQQVPLDDVLEHLEKQTGNRLMDYRGHIGQERTPRTLSLSINDRDFWPAADEILDQAALKPYEFSGDEGLGLVELEPGSTTRKSRGSYAGPFRIEATELTTRRSMVTPSENRLNVTINVAWEPRLQPISMTQKVADVSASDDRDEPVPIKYPDAEFDIDLQQNSYATEILLPFELPNRKSSRLKSLTGKLTVLAPARQVEFRFGKIKESLGTEKEADGVFVKLTRFVPLEGLCEIHMRIRVKGKAAELDSHGDWVFDNLAVLENADGKTLDNAGYETTMRSNEEIGFAYLYELEGDIADYTWVYKTPAAIRAKTIEYELRNLPLP